MSKSINSLQALLEYAHKLPWGESNGGAVCALDELLSSYATDVPSSDDGGGCE